MQSMQRSPLAIALSVGAFLLAPAAASAAQVFVAPNGSGATCTEAAPCPLYPALSGAAPGDEVIIEPGDYGSAALPLNADGQINTAGLNVPRVGGQAPPRVFSTH